MTSQPGRRRGAAIAADRAAVVGVRQLRDALQGLRPEGRAARPVREGRRRRPGPPLHRGRADRRPPHPVGPGRRLRRPRRATPPTSGSRSGTINSNTFQDDDYMLGSVCHPDARVRRKAARPPARLRRRHGRDRLARPQAVVRGRDQLPRSGRHPRAAGPAGRGARRRPRPARRRTSGWSSSTSSSSRRSTRWTCPTGGPPTSSAWRPGPKAKVVVDTGHHAPGTNIEFIVASLLRADRLGGFDFNSRFYADDDLMVGSADPFQLFRIMHEVVQAGALDADLGRRVHARPVPQHRTQDPGPDPLGDERPGGDRQGAPRRRRGARRGAGSAATSWARTPS